MFFSEYKSSFVGNRGWDELRERFRITDFERSALNPNHGFVSNIIMFCIERERTILLFTSFFAILFQYSLHNDAKD